MLEDKYVNGRALGPGRADALSCGGRMADGVMQIHRPGAGHHVHHGDRWVPILFFVEKDADSIS
jgi:hypothetical protein